MGIAALAQSEEKKSEAPSIHLFTVRLQRGRFSKASVVSGRVSRAE